MHLQLEVFKQVDDVEWKPGEDEDKKHRHQDPTSTSIPRTLGTTFCNGSALGNNALPSLLQLADDFQVGNRAGNDREGELGDKEEKAVDKSGGSRPNLNAHLVTSWANLPLHVERVGDDCEDGEGVDEADHNQGVCVVHLS